MSAPDWPRRTPRVHLIRSARPPAAYCALPVGADTRLAGLAAVDRVTCLECRAAYDRERRQLRLPGMWP